MKLLGIIVATLDEERAVRFAMKEAVEEEGAAGLLFIRGRLGEVPAVAVRAGIGKVNAALCAQMLIDRYQPEAVINVGVAGALDPSLHIADVVIARDAVQHDFDTTFFGDALGQITGLPSVEIPADASLGCMLAKACEAAGVPYRFGRILSGDQFICDAAKKAWLVSQFDGTCTEMEGASVAQVCMLNGVPFCILRSISDGAGDDAGMQYSEFAALAAERAGRILQAIRFSEA